MTGGCCYAWSPGHLFWCELMFPLWLLLVGACCCTQFKDWFSNPLTGAVETGQEVSRQLVERLHGVLRPFLLRYAALRACSVLLKHMVIGRHATHCCYNWELRLCLSRHKQVEHRLGSLMHCCHVVVPAVCLVVFGMCIVLNVMWCLHVSAGGSSQRWRSRCRPSMSTC